MILNSFLQFFMVTLDKPFATESTVVEAVVGTLWTAIELGYDFSSVRDSLK